MIDLEGVYDGHDKHSLWIAEWDNHPNVEGHKLVADRLYDLIRQHASEIFTRPDPERDAGNYLNLEARSP